MTNKIKLRYVCVCVCQWVYRMRTFVPGQSRDIQSKLDRARDRRRRRRSKFKREEDMHAEHRKRLAVGNFRWDVFELSTCDVRCLSRNKFDKSFRTKKKRCIYWCELSRREFTTRWSAFLMDLDPRVSVLLYFWRGIFRATELLFPFSKLF